MGAYLISWRYRIKPEQKDRFEQEYGPRGSWNQFFSRDKAYLGSDLHQQHNDAHCYLLCDRWTSKNAFDAFISRHSETYQQLSRQFESLYLSEELLGSWTNIE
jgi:quinol monooxygenase YgiN